MKICHVVHKTLNYDISISFKYFLWKIWGVCSFETRQIFKFLMYSKNTKTLKDSLDTYSNLNLMKICHVVHKTLNYDVGISFKYFLWKFEECAVLKHGKFSNSRCSYYGLLAYKYKYYKTFYGKPKIAFKSKVNCLVPPMT